MEEEEVNVEQQIAIEDVDEYQEENVFSTQNEQEMLGNENNSEQYQSNRDRQDGQESSHGGRPSEVLSKIDHQDEEYQDDKLEFQELQQPAHPPLDQPASFVQAPANPALNQDLNLQVPPKPTQSVEVKPPPQGTNMVEMAAKLRQQYQALQMKIAETSPPKFSSPPPVSYPQAQSPGGSHNLNTSSYNDNSQINRSSLENINDAAKKGKSRLAKMILNDIDEQKLPTAEEVQKDSVNSYAQLLKEENEKKAKKKKEQEALEKLKREQARATELKKMTPLQRQMEQIKERQKRQAAERKRKKSRSPDQQRTKERSPSGYDHSQVVERLFGSKKDRERDEKKAQSRALVIAKLNSNSPKRGMHDNVQYNVIPLKDFAFEDEQNPNTFTSTFTFMRNQYERTEQGETRNDIKYLKTLKYKKQQKKRFDFEFDDLKVKNETHYQNPLYEQTRKIFLNDLDDLKKKIKGRQQRIINQHRSMSPADDQSSTQIGSSYTLNGGGGTGYYGGGTHAHNSRQATRMFDSVYREGADAPQHIRGLSTAQTVLSGHTAKFPLSKQTSQNQLIASGRLALINGSNVPLQIREFTNSSTQPLEQLLQSHSVAMLQQRQNSAEMIGTQGSHTTSQNYLSNPQIMVEISSNQQQMQGNHVGSSKRISTKQSSGHPPGLVMSSHTNNQEEDVYHSETGQAFYLTEPPLLLLGSPPADEDQDIGPFTTNEKTPLTMYTNFNRKQTFASLKGGVTADQQTLVQSKKIMSLQESPREGARKIFTADSVTNFQQPILNLVSSHRDEKGNGVGTMQEMKTLQIQEQKIRYSHHTYQEKQDEGNNQGRLVLNKNSNSFINDSSEFVDQDNNRLSGHQGGYQQSAKDSIESMQVVLHPKHSKQPQVNPYDLSNKHSSTHPSSNQGFYFQKNNDRQTSHAQKGSIGFPKIDKTVTIQLPSTKPPLHTQNSRNSLIALQKNQRATVTMSSSLKKSKIPMKKGLAPLALMADPHSASTQTVVIQTPQATKIHFHKQFKSMSPSSRRRRKSPTEGTVPGESTTQFMGHGLKSIGILEPLVIHKKFQMQAQNYPHKELFQTIPSRKFRVNGVKVVDRYNHMKKQIFDFIKSHNNQTQITVPKQLIPMITVEQPSPQKKHELDQYALVPV